MYSLSSPTRNVVSRVTGGAASTINGLLGVDPAASGGTPAFFFINPAGITFGAGAVLDVPGAFHASTAHSLKLPDGVLYADRTRDSTFSSADPVAFGFLSPATGSIALRDGAYIKTTNAPLSLTAGRIDIDAGLVEGYDTATVRVAATGSSTADIPLAGPLPALAGTLTLAREGRIMQIAGDPAAGGGGIEVSAGTVVIDGSAGTPFYTGIYSYADGAAHGGKVKVDVQGDLSMANGGVIYSMTSGTGNGGSIAVRAANVAMSGDSAAYPLIGSESLAGSSGHAGAVTVDASNRVAITGAGVISSTTFGAGNAGTVEVNAASMLMEGSAVSFSDVRNDVADGSTGAGAGVTVRVSGDLTLREGATIVSTTWGRGPAGAVEVSASNLVIEGGATSTSEISSQAGSSSPGAAGAVTVRAAGDITMRGAAVVSSTTLGAGNAGNVDVSAASFLMEGAGTSFRGVVSEANQGSTGNAGSVSLSTTGDVVLRRAGSISSSTWGVGDAGSVAIRASNVVVDGAGGEFYVGVSSEARRGSGGNAGSVAIAASGGVTLRDAAVISSSSLGTGRAGAVDISGSTVTVLGDGRASLTAVKSNSGTAGGEGAGSVTVRALESVVLEGAGEISSVTSGASRGGAISVTAGRTLRMRGDAQITSSTFGAGPAGSVDLHAADVVIEGQDGRGTAVLSAAGRGSTGSGGSVSIAATGNVSLTGNAFVSSSTSGPGRAGSVDIAATDIVLQGTTGGSPSIDSTASAAGDAGSVTVTASRDLVVRDAIISSSTFADGAAGSVSLRARNVTIDGSASDVWSSLVASSSGDGSGNAGSVTIAATGTVNITGASRVSSSTVGAGRGGSIDISASDVVIEGTADGSPKILSNSIDTGDSGPIRINATRDFALRNGVISASAVGGANAGAIDIHAANVLVEGQVDFWRSVESSSNGAGDSGSIKVDASGAFVLRNGSISSLASGSGRAGSIEINAGSVLIEGTASSDPSLDSTTLGAGNAGGIRIKAARDFVLRDNAISSSTIGDGNAGSIELNAANVLIEGTGTDANFRNVGLFSESGFGKGNAGTVQVKAADNLTMRGRASVSTSTWNSGNAGSISLSAANVVLEGDELPIFEGVVSEARFGSTGNAGSVTVTAANDVTLSRGALVSTRTDGSGSAGNVTVTAGGTISVIDGGAVSSNTSGSGDAGSVRLAARNIVVQDSLTGDILLEGVSSGAEVGSTGRAGSVTVTATNGIRLDSGVISSSTYGPGAAGNVTVTAGGDLSVRGASSISSSTHGGGNAGSVEVSAAGIRIEGRGTLESYGVLSDATFGSTGHAGSVKVTGSGDLALLRGAVISSSTAGKGHAGSVSVSAANVLLEGSAADYTKIASETSAEGNAGA